MPQISSPSMASMALQLKNNSSKTLVKPYTSSLTLYNHYSSSSNKNGGQNPKKPLDFASFFPDIKSTLKNPNRSPSNDNIARNIAEFRQRSNPNPDPKSVPNPKGNVFDGIRESLRHLQGSKGQTGNFTRDGGGDGNRLSLNKYKENFRPNVNTNMGKVYGGSLDSLSSMAFRKELGKEKGKGEGGGRVEDEWESTRLFRDYTFDDLGDRLRELRPEASKGEGERGDEWFSFGELNERLKKLRVIEKNLSPKTITIVRDSMMKMKHEQDQAQKTAANKLFVLGGIHKMKESTPKEHLIERYFHPDNMSSEEKMKLKLKEVRDEFKMHESDCGSTRVQIAQLTTEIIHLSAVLHKKDKHSRRGLLAKVQQRKKLLKYLRRTDWDSYCFVLSKLGLRDNPDYKN